MNFLFSGFSGGGFPQRRGGAGVQSTDLRAHCLKFQILIGIVFGIRMFPFDLILSGLVVEILMGNSCRKYLRMVIDFWFTAGITLSLYCCLIRDVGWIFPFISVVLN